MTDISSPNDNLEFDYDNKNRIIQVTNNTGTIEFTYDDLNRITSTTDFWNNTVSYTYDKNGNLISSVIRDHVITLV